MNSSQDEVTIFVKCGDGFRKGDTLCHVGAYFCDGENVKHPLDTCNSARSFSFVNYTRTI